jgi:hypothetical protein
MKFSQRQGLTPIRSVLQTKTVESELRNRLWNLVHSTFFASAPVFPTVGNFLPGFPEQSALFKDLWHNYFKEPTDTIGVSYMNALDELRSRFMGCEWYSVYDLIEFFSNHIPERLPKTNFMNSVNRLLKEEVAGYRFVSGQIVEITSEEEILSVEHALALPEGLKTVTSHLRQALTLLADKRKPDYRNSIKESISAIESICKILSGLPKTTLGPALNAIETKTKLHPSLKEAFHKLYSYTSDDEGIRHALMQEPTLDFEDAKFMLVSCSAFVNYIVVKASKAGINI